MPTASRLAWSVLLAALKDRGVPATAVLSDVGVDETTPLLLKKEVICRCEGSMDAPANWRFVLGTDIWRGMTGEWDELVV